MACVNTYYPGAGPTYYGPRKETGTIDIGPISSALLEGIKTCIVAWKRGRKLQLIPDAQPRGHLPFVFHDRLRDADDRPPSPATQMELYKVGSSTTTRRRPTRIPPRARHADEIYHRPAVQLCRPAAPRF
eukprot:6121541-Pyramimonas_sp.AAC.1